MRDLGGRREFGCISAELQSTRSQDGEASSSAHILLGNGKYVGASRVREDDRRRTVLGLGVKYTGANRILVLVGVMKSAVGVHGSPDRQPGILLEPVAVGTCCSVALVAPLTRTHSMLNTRFPGDLLQLGVLWDTLEQ